MPNLDLILKSFDKGLQDAQDQDLLQSVWSMVSVTFWGALDALSGYVQGYIEGLDKEEQ